ncbi:phospholipid scramblase 1 [Agyrium rufum]|nr:phospholipid scramblase 1 [Agyrium rufum]
MANKILLVYIVFDLLFAGNGALILAFSLITKNHIKQTPTAHNVAHNILLSQAPLTPAIVNAILIFFTFLISIPAILSSRNRFLLRLQSWLIIICALFTLVIGIDLWFFTLRTRANLGGVWGHQSADVQSLLQGVFNCCGYTNSQTPPFVTDDTCPTVAAAAAKLGCASGFALLANHFDAILFTALFGVAGIDAFAFLAVVVVLKDRAERMRFRVIDEKGGNGI